MPPSRPSQANFFRLSFLICFLFETVGNTVISSRKSSRIQEYFRKTLFLTLPPHPLDSVAQGTHAYQGNFASFSRSASPLSFLRPALFSQGYFGFFRSAKFSQGRLSHSTWFYHIIVASICVLQSVLVVHKRPYTGIYQVFRSEINSIFQFLKVTKT